MLGWKKRYVQKRHKSWRKLAFPLLICQLSNLNSQIGHFTFLSHRIKNFVERIEVKMNDLKKNILRLQILLGIIFVLHQIPVGNAKELYQLNINETGESFNEVIEIDDKKKTVVYKVPSHNEIKQTDVMVDYKNGHFATKIPARRACYIKKFPTADEQSIREIRQNLKLVQVIKSQTKGKIPVKIVNRIMKRIRQIPREELSAKIREFCGHNIAYQVEEEVQRNRGSSIAKRTGVQSTQNYKFSNVLLNVTGKSLQKKLPNGYLTCKKVQKHTQAILKCIEKDKPIQLGCGLFPVTCRYQATCNLLPSTIDKINSKSNRSDAAAYAYINVEMKCVEQHMFTAEWCCDVLPCD